MQARERAAVNKMSGANASARAGSRRLSQWLFLLMLLFCAGCDRLTSQEAFNTAVKYQNGAGVPKDSGKAAELYTKAAKHDYAPAEFNLAVMYQSGDGVPKDSAQAARWYAQAAEHGDKEA